MNSRSIIPVIVTITLVCPAFSSCDSNSEEHAPWVDTYTHQRLGINRYVEPAGAVWSWGTNASGYFGDGSVMLAYTPMEVTAPVAFAKVGAAAHSSWGITTGGDLYWWGEHLFDSGFADSPTRIELDFPVADLSCIEDSCVFLGTDGLVRTNYDLAGDWALDTIFPTVSASLVATAVTIGRYRACALDTGGSAWCWGENDAGQAVPGDSRTFIDTPTRVAGGPYTQLTAGPGLLTCGLTAEGEAMCWGVDDTFDLDGPDAPVLVTPEARYTAIWAGYFLVGALAQGGLVNYDNAATTTLPDVAFTAIDGYEYGYCALADDGTLYCFGGRDAFKGAGESPDFSTAVPPVGGGVSFANFGVGGTPPTCLSTEEQHVCGLAADGRTLCWGGNTAHQLGQYLVTASATPLMTPSDLDIIATTGPLLLDSAGDLYISTAMIDEDILRAGLWPVATGYGFERLSHRPGGLLTCAIDGAGRVSCFDVCLNGYEVTFQGPCSPTSVDLPAPAAQVVTVTTMGCAIVEGGAVHCWALPTNTRTPSCQEPPCGASAPVLLPAKGKAAWLAADNTHLLVLTTDGELFGYMLDTQTELFQEPFALPSSVPAVKVWFSNGQLLGLTAEGALVTWRSLASDGELYYEGHLPFTTVAFTDSYSGEACALTADERIYCFTHQQPPTLFFDPANP